MRAHRLHRTTWLILLIAALTASLAVAFINPASSSASTLRPATATLGKRATVVLKTLKVKRAASMRGYSRAQFGTAWTDKNGAPLGHNRCDTRDDILRRDLVRARYKGSSRCVIATGTLHDPYAGKLIHFVRGVRTSSAVQIDHIVALGDAWQTGARTWTKARRTNLANDPLNLLAVNQHSNESKGDDDAASWLPRRSYRCAYVARQIAVKARYHLWVTGTERRAMVKVLATCPTRRIPTEAAATRLRKVAPGTPSAPAPTKTVEFANCTEMHAVYPHGVGRPGAVDHTSGTPDTEFYVSTSLYNANTKSDRDKDGIACEA